MPSLGACGTGALREVAPSAAVGAPLVQCRSSAVAALKPSRDQAQTPGCSEGRALDPEAWWHRGCGLRKGGSGCPPKEVWGQCVASSLRRDLPLDSLVTVLPLSPRCPAKRARGSSRPVALALAALGPSHGLLPDFFLRGCARFGQLLPTPVKCWASKTPVVVPPKPKFTASPWVPTAPPHPDSGYGAPWPEARPRSPGGLPGVGDARRKPLRAERDLAR